MNRWIAAGWIGSLACLPVLGQLPAANDPPALIERLGSGTFAEREAAAQELKKRGAAVLEALDRAARTSTDAEVRQRASRLCAEIRAAQESQKFITPKLVTLNHTNVPLATVVNELRQQTGLPLTLDTHGCREPLRKVTVVTNGPVPAWEAVEQLCRQAGLKELFPAEIAVPNARPNRRMWDDEFGQLPSVSPGSVPITLADGAVASLPGSRHTAVRILALPPSFPGSRVVRGSGEAIIHLDVTPSPGINWNDVVGIHVNKAEDETGRPVSASRLADLSVAAGGSSMIWAGGGFIMMNSYYYGGPRPTSMPNPRIVPLTLRTDDRASRKLRTFEGVLVAEASIPNVEVLRIENIATNLQVTHAAGLGQQITVVDFAPQKDGIMKIRVRIENLPLTSRRRGMINPMVFGGMMMVEETTLGSSSQLKSFSFLDANGKEVTRPRVGQTTMVESANGFAQEIEAVFPKGVKPVKMVVKGTRGVTLEVPFSMSNVMLP